MKYKKFIYKDGRNIIIEYNNDLIQFIFEKYDNGNFVIFQRFDDILFINAIVNNCFERIYVDFVKNVRFENNCVIYYAYKDNAIFDIHLCLL